MAKKKPAREERPAGRNNRVYEILYRKILEGRFQPGDQLKEKDIATMTKASRTPVREALRMLAARGLVIMRPNGRSYVAEIGVQDASIVFEIRARLESMAAGLAARNITEDELDELRRIEREIEKLGARRSERSLAKFMALNAQFHQTIVRASRSHYLDVALYPVLSIPLVFMKHYVWQKDVDFVRSNRHHREIIQALKERNVTWASSCMASHILSRAPSGDIAPGTGPVMGANA